jgi:hypothetical protein
MLFLSLNLVQVQGYSQLQAGLTFLPFTADDLSGPLCRAVLPTGMARGLADRGALWHGWGGDAAVVFWGETQGPSDYWTSFFPGVLVFGLGMAITVAPLTATVMGSAGQQFSGVASGVNNAMSRIANVFANAIFGALAVLLFTGALEGRWDGGRGTGLPMAETAKLDASEDVKQAVMAQAADLGECEGCRKR